MTNNEKQVTVKLEHRFIGASYNVILSLETGGDGIDIACPKRGRHREFELALCLEAGSLQKLRDAIDKVLTKVD